MMKYLLWLKLFLIFKLVGYYVECAQIVDNKAYTTPTHYLPKWESLDTRPLPVWYDEAKIGIFIHWGVYSVPAHGTEWFWYNWKERRDPGYVRYMEKNYSPKFTYQNFAQEFKAELFNPNEWADLFEAAGAKYVVFTSKHHEGYAMWPSKYSFGWNSMDIGPKRDIIGELATSIRSRTKLKFGLYHSLYEWFNPLYLNDKDSDWCEEDYVTFKVKPQLYELVQTYYPDILWSDGDWEAPDTYWSSTEFIAWLYNTSPVKDTIVVNDRWGEKIICKHGDFYTCADRYNPGVLQPHKWENAFTIDRKSWGYRPDTNITDYLTIQEIITEVVSTVSCNGNILMNVGPTSNGKIIPIYQERLLQIGQWLSINGRAIYVTEPWKIQNDPITKSVWYTLSIKNRCVYAITLEWPKDSHLYLKYDGQLFTNKTKVHLINERDLLPLEWTIIMTEQITSKVEITMPDLSKVDSQWAWTLQIKNPKLLIR